MTEQKGKYRGWKYTVESFWGGGERSYGGFADRDSQHLVVSSTDFTTCVKLIKAAIRHAQGTSQ